MSKNININISPYNLGSKNRIQRQWEALLLSTDASVFLSWPWISCWLDQVDSSAWLVEATISNKIVGLGVLVENQRKSLGLFPIKQIWLHRTGNRELDQVWHEHNDFLIQENNNAAIRDEIIAAIYERFLNYEFILGLSSDEVIASCASKYHVNYAIETLGYFIDLNKLNTTSYEQEVLSRNSRYQIKRTERLLSEKGELVFDVIQEKNNIKSLLPDIAFFHIKKWGQSTEGSGFENTLFVEFHKELINHDKAEAHVVMLSLNNEPIGYLLNYIYKNKVYFYLSALSSDFDSKHKIGLLLHVKAINYYHSIGASQYDFLGGDMQYKRSLAKGTYPLKLAVCYQPRLLLTVEKLLKKIKAKLNL